MFYNSLILLSQNFFGVQVLLLFSFFILVSHISQKKKRQKNVHLGLDQFISYVR